MLNKEYKLVISIIIIISIILVPCLNAYIYFSSVDFNWIINDLIKNSGINPNSGQIITPKILMYFTIITTFSATTMLIVFWYLYFKILFEKRCTDLSSDDVVDYLGVSFIGSAVSAWTTFFLLLTRNTSQIRLNDLKVFSINSIWLDQDASSKWYGIATSVDLMSLLGFASLLFLFDRYSQKSLMINFCLAILPDVAFYGLWSIYLCFKS